MSTNIPEEQDIDTMPSTNRCASSSAAHLSSVPMSIGGSVPTIENDSNTLPFDDQEKMTGLGQVQETTSRMVLELDQQEVNGSLSSSTCPSAVNVPEKRCRRAPERFVAGGTKKPTEQEEEEEEEETKADKRKKIPSFRQKRKRSISVNSQSDISSKDSDTDSDEEGSASECSSDEDGEEEEDDTSSISSDSTVYPSNNRPDSFCCPVCRKARYAMCSRRGIRIHVIRCAIKKFKLNPNATYEQVCAVLSNKHTRERLRGFMFRRHTKKRTNQDLPFLSRWYCPYENRGCRIYFHSNSTVSKRMHSKNCEFRKCRVQKSPQEMEKRKDAQMLKWSLVEKKKKQKELEQTEKAAQPAVKKARSVKPCAPAAAASALLSVLAETAKTTLKRDKVADTEKSLAIAPKKKTKTAQPLSLPTSASAQPAAAARARVKIDYEVPKEDEENKEEPVVEAQAIEIDKTKTTTQVRRPVVKAITPPVQVVALPSALLPPTMIVPKKIAAVAAKPLSDRTKVSTTYQNKKKHKQDEEEVIQAVPVRSRQVQPTAALTGNDVVLPNSPAVFSASPLALMAAAAQHNPQISIPGHALLHHHRSMPYSYLPLDDSIISPALSSLGYQSTMSSCSTAFLHHGRLQVPCCPAAHAMSHLRHHPSIPDMNMQFCSPLIESHPHCSSFSSPPLTQSQTHASSGFFTSHMMPPPAAFHSTENRKRKEPDAANQSCDPRVHGLPPSHSLAAARETSEAKRLKKQVAASSDDEVSLTTPQSHARTVSSSDGTLQLLGSRPSTSVEVAAAAAAAAAPNSRATPVWTDAAAAAAIDPDASDLMGNQTSAARDGTDQHHTTDRKKLPASRFHLPPQLSSDVAAMLAPDTLNPRPLRSVSLGNGSTAASVLDERSHRSSPKLMSLNRTATSGGFMPLTPESSHSFSAAIIHPDLENTKLPESLMSLNASESEYGRHTPASMGRSVMRREFASPATSDHLSIRAMIHRQQQQQQQILQQQQHQGQEQALTNLVTSLSSSCSLPAAAAVAADSAELNQLMDSEMMIMDTVELICRNEAYKKIPNLRMQVLQKLVFDPRR